MIKDEIKPNSQSNNPTEFNEAGVRYFREEKYEAAKECYLKAIALNPNIDVYYENVGGAIWQAVLPLLNNFARIPVSGLIAQYNGVEKGDGTDRLPATSSTANSIVETGWLPAQDEAEGSGGVTRSETDSTKE